MALADRLEQELGTISEEYGRDFAGQSRRTRDRDQLARLIKRTETVLGQVAAIPSAARDKTLHTVHEEATKMVSMYKTEDKAIVQAQSVGPEFEEFSAFATRANFTFSRYGRAFAGQSRATRDARLLDELVGELEEVLEGMTEVAGKNPKDPYAKDVELVSTTLASYKREQIEIRKAQAAGTKEERANALAQVANGQFALYRMHFAGKDRSSRRPQLIVRMVDTLKETQATMLELKEQGYSEEFHDKNLAVVKEQLELFENELSEIRKARKGTDLADLVGGLGGAANQLFEEYRANFAGKDRRKVDRAILEGICERLWEVYRQMREFARAGENETNARNLEIVTEQLELFEREFEAVTQVQSPN